MPKAARINSRASGCKALRDFIDFLPLEIGNLFQRSGILTEKQTALVQALPHIKNQVQFLEKKEWVNQNRMPRVSLFAEVNDMPALAICLLEAVRPSMEFAFHVSAGNAA